MLFFLSLIGILLSVILLSFNRKNFGANIYLGFFFLFLSLYAFSQYILLYSKSVNLIVFFLYNFAFLASVPYLIGPMLLWYIRSILSDNPKLKYIDGLHLLPWLIYFLLSIPQNLVPHSDKIASAIALVNDTDFIAHFKGTPLSGFFPIEAIFLSRPLWVLGYTLWSIGLIERYLRKNEKTGVFSGQHFMTKWLTLLLSFLLLLIVTQILNIARAFNLEFSEMYFTLNLVRLLSGLGLIGLMVSPFFFPSILYGLPRIPSPTTFEKPDEIKADPQSAVSAKTRLKLETDYLHHIYQKTESFMTENQPYLEPEFNLPQLSVHIQVPAHHLGYYFREVKKQTFNDYRNKWRVNHAKKLIEEGKAGEMTLEAIGMLSGFSSRNTFITDFKKFEGESPGSYASRFN
jgi:AraC-like DNA-binding protein